MSTETERPAAPDLINGMGRINRISSTTSSQSHQQLLGGSGSNIQNPSSQLFLEQKVGSLEKRLLIVENFIGSKFCESFLDFSSASLNQGGDGDRNESGSSQKKRKNQESGHLSHQERQDQSLAGVASAAAVGVRGHDNIPGPFYSSTSGFSSASTSPSAAGAPCTVFNTFSLQPVASSSSDFPPTDATSSSSRWQDSPIVDASNFACSNGHGQDEEMDFGNVELQKFDSNDNSQIDDDDNENEHVNFDDIENLGDGVVPTTSDQPSIVFNTGSSAIRCFGGNGHDGGVTYTTTGKSGISEAPMIGVGPPPLLVLVPTDYHSDDSGSHPNFIEDEKSFGIGMELEETLSRNQNGNANHKDTGSQNRNHEVTMNSSTPNSTSMPQQSSLNGVAMPSEEFLKRIGYRHRLIICLYCKNPCILNHRFRHLKKHCEEVTPAQLLFEESKKGSIEHWAKPTLSDYENFYKDEMATGYFDMDDPTSFSKDVHRVQKKRRKSVPAAAGSAKKKSTTNKIANGQSTLSKRGRPKGTFKIYKCEKCGKRMHRIAFQLHKKKCANNLSDKEDHDDEDDDGDSGVGNDMKTMKLVLDKIANCTVCGKFMLSRRISQYLREACKGAPEDVHQSQSK